MRVENVLFARRDADVIYFSTRDVEGSYKMAPGEACALGLSASVER